MIRAGLAAIVLASACSFTGLTNQVADDQPAIDASGTTADAPFPIDAPAIPDAAPDADLNPTCAKGFAPLPGLPVTSWYLAFDWASFLGAQTSWGTAATVCAALGAHLVVIDDATEAAVVGASVVVNPGDPAFWVGASDQLVEGVWLLPDGSQATYLPWWPGGMVPGYQVVAAQPTNGAGDNCVLQAASAFFDYPCAFAGDYAYVCECE